MDQTAEVRPGFVLAAVRHRWRTVVVGAVIGLLLGLAALTQLAGSYSSQAQLFLNPLVGNPLSPDLGTNRTDQLAALETEAALIKTSAVADRAAAASDEKLPASPEDDLAVDAPSNTQVLDLTYTAGSSAVARAGAQAFADAYLAYRTAQAVEYNADRATLIQQQQASTAAIFDTASDALADADPGSATEQQLQSQLTIYSEKLAQLQLDLIDANNTLPSPGRVITPATGALTQSGLPAWLVLFAALVVGAGLGGVVALAKEHSDERIRDADEVTAVGVGHSLAEVAVGGGAFPLTRPAPAGYRVLSTAVLARARTGSNVTCVLSVDATVAVEVAAGLAAAAYRQGSRALVLGADRPPAWGAALTVSVEDITAAGGHVSLPTDDRWLVVVPVDHTDEAAEEFVLSTTLERFVNTVRSQAVVCLAGGSSASAAGLRLAMLADLTLVVVELGRDTFTDVVDVVETLQEAGVEHIGLVVAHSERPAGSALQRISRRARPAAAGPQASGPATTEGAATAPAAPRTPSAPWAAAADEVAGPAVRDAETQRPAAPPAGASAMTATPADPRPQPTPPVPRPARR